MGVDLQLLWNKMGQRAYAAQGSHTPAGRRGRVGYLHESYHGGPYVIPFLAREAVHSPSLEQLPRRAHIPASTLRQRCGDAVALAVLRDVKLYRGGRMPGFRNSAQDS